MIDQIFIKYKGKIDSVLLDRSYLKDLAEEKESRILLERIKQYENDPDSAIPWKDIKRT